MVFRLLGGSHFRYGDASQPYVLYYHQLNTTKITRALLLKDRKNWHKLLPEEYQGLFVG
jgi:hypothetical protein